MYYINKMHATEFNRKSLLHFVIVIKSNHMWLTLCKEKCVGQTKSHHTPTMNVYVITNNLLNNTNMKAAQIEILIMQLKMTCKNSLTGKFLEQSVMMTGIIVSKLFHTVF